MAGRKKQTYGKEGKPKANVYVVTHGQKAVNQAWGQLQRPQPYRAEAIVQQLVTLFDADRKGSNIVKRK